MKINELKNPQRVMPTSSQNTPPEENNMQPERSTFDSFSLGVGKGIGSSVLGLGKIGYKMQQGISSAAGKVGLGNIFKTQENSIYNPESQKGQLADSVLTPQGTAEKVGFGAEKLAEFFIPASSAAKAEGFVNILSSGMRSPLAAATTRVVGKSVVQGTAAGLVSAVQTGGDLKETAKTALTAGVLRGTFATIGEGARAIKLPERLYSTIFKTTADDMMMELKTENLANMQKTNPARFADLVKRGIIKTRDGQIILDETLAKQALDKGLRGSIRNMARTVIDGTYESEAKVQDVLKNYNGTVDLTEPQFQNVLKGVSQRYQDVGFNEISNEADRLAAVLKSSGGKVDGNTALQIRRLLDRARIASSFDAPAEKLSLGQANLKTLADTARSRLNSIPGMGEVMKNYSFYIDALDTLAKEAARRGNNQALSLIDSLFLSSSFGGNNVVPGITAGILRKILMSGAGVTTLGQALNKSTLGTAGSGIVGGASSLANQLSPKQ